MNRRELIALLGSTAAAWPLGAGAQQNERMRRIGVLMPFAIGSPQYQARVGAFLQRFTELGWTGAQRADRISREHRQPRATWASDFPTLAIWNAQAPASATGAG